MFNEKFRIYKVIVWRGQQQGFVLDERTRDEAKTALEAHLSSWTTKAVTVINTRDGRGKTWLATPENRAKARKRSRS